MKKQYLNGRIHVDFENHLMNLSIGRSSEFVIHLMWTMLMIAPEDSEDSRFDSVRPWRGRLE